MASLAVLHKTGVYYRGLNLVAGFQNLDAGSIEPGQILSWKEEFPAFHYKLENAMPHLINLGKATIYISFAVKDSIGCADAEVRVESSDIGDLAKAVERVIAYMGGRIATFDVNPTEPNSLVGGVTNDWKRLRNFCCEWIRAKRQQLGFRVIG